MLICTIIHDRKIARSPANAPVSLLTMPLGVGTVLEHLCDCAAEAGSTDFVVFLDDETMRPEIEAAAERTAHTVRILNEALLDDAIHRLEPSDRVLFVDPGYWPAAGYDFALLSREAEAFSGAINAVAMGAPGTDASERVIIDPAGRVRRIRRLYQGVTRVDRPAGSISYSFVPAVALADIHYSELTALPVALARRGVLVRDIPLACDLFDATTEHDYLALSELAQQRVMAKATPEEYSRLGTQVLTGRGAMIHKTARLVGPVIVQSGASVGQNATVIGPTVIGRSSRVGAGALVAQAVLPEQTTVEAGASVRHCLAPRVVSTAAPALGADPLDFHAPPQLDLTGPESIAPDLEDAGVIMRGALAAKRWFDFAASLIGLLILAPLLLVVAILIKLDSRGPVFFSHYREGRFGKLFPCLKFRTMRSDAHQLQRALLEANDLDGPHFKIASDPRITRVGRILRNTNIDELPQLFNVLVGQMSLVGPRPSPFRENQICVPWRRARLSVRPGITGLWQICRAQRTQGDFQQWIHYDILYVRHMTPWLDLKILFATFWALATGNEIRIESLLPTGPTEVPIDWRGLDARPTLTPPHRRKAG